MLTIDISGLEGLGAALDRLSRLEELDRALRRSAEAVRDLAARNLPGVEPPSAEAGAAPLTWRVVSASETGWRAEWGGVNDAPRPWLQPAVDALREDIVRNAAGGVAAAARALR